MNLPSLGRKHNPSMQMDKVELRVHHGVGYPVPSTHGGTAHVTGSRSPHAYDRGVRCDERTRGRVGRALAALCGRMRGRYGHLDPAWTPPADPTRDDLTARSPADPSRSAVVPPGL